MNEKMNIELRDPRTLKPYPKNAKKHSPAQIENLKNMILANGWTQPVVVDKNDVIIIGHGRTLAGIEIGKPIPVAVFHGTETQANALRLADNQIVSKDYDMDLLQAEMAELASEMDLTTLGYTAKDIEFMVNPLETMDESAFIDDIQSAVETQREENDSAGEAMDAATSPLGDAFGFRRMTIAQSRRVRGFMGRIEAETGKKGVEALMVFFDNMGVA